MALVQAVNKYKMVLYYLFKLARRDPTISRDEMKLSVRQQVIVQDDVVLTSPWLEGRRQQPIIEINLRAVHEFTIGVGVLRGGSLEEWVPFNLQEGKGTSIFSTECWHSTKCLSNDKLPCMYII